ncbi:MAG TPA: nicotinate (nicotinamide) nucleotide adenylyltransferase [Pyrinomonadaceae bacterium]|nr:nicotinate (nicotinamide) nucleotide adenylyltransferase [Pyrinomonadaceae bacterium]
MSKRIAFFGGSFDPPHIGHITIARQVLKYFALDKFFFLPAFHAPHKANLPGAGAFHRFAMLTMATAGFENILVSDLELKAGKPRYTFDSLNEILALFPGDEIFFVMGGDSWEQITTWHRWQELLTLTGIIVVTRPGFELPSDHVGGKIKPLIHDLRSRLPNEASQLKADRIYFCDFVNLDIAATMIRDDVAVDGRLDNLDTVTPEIASYIEKYELYR